MPVFFTQGEVKWLRVVANDYARYRSTERDASPFLERAVAAWVQRFPYRHPRLCEHLPHAEQEDGLEQYASDYWKLIEVRETMR